MLIESFIMLRHSTKTVPPLVVTAAEVDGRELKLFEAVLIRIMYHEHHAIRNVMITTPTFYVVYNLLL